MLAGRYELQAHLGGGAVGQVWAARDTRFDRPVAVKIVRIAQSQDIDADQALARFEREVLATGRLSHPNVARAYDAGRDGDDLFLVTELIDGESVADLLLGRTAPLPIDAALELAEQVCAGLAAAHDEGIVHRDLKPANVMVGDDAVVKIIDFGIARFIETNLPQLTRPGMMVGTLAYAAPEQLSGGGVDPRSDLYALGCMLYELIAGVRPFTDPTVEGLIWQHLHDDATPLEQVRPQTPPMLARLVAEMMRKDPKDRPADARTVRARIEACLAALPLPPRVDYDPTDPVVVDAAGNPVPAGPRVAVTPGGAASQPAPGTQMGGGSPAPAGVPAPPDAPGGRAEQPVPAAVGPVAVGPVPYAGEAAPVTPVPAGATPAPAPDAPPGQPGVDAVGLSGPTVPLRKGAAAGGMHDSTMVVGEQPRRDGTLFMNPAEMPAGPGPESAPPGGGGGGRGGDGWHGRTYLTADRRRDRRRKLLLPAIAGAVVLIAAVVVVVYLLTGSSGGPGPRPTPTPFAVTGVTAKETPHGCTQTVDVVGTITTNGQAGTVTYQWLRSDKVAEPQQTATVAAGKSSVQVHLKWTFTSILGIGGGTATLKIINPAFAKQASADVSLCG